MVGKWQKVEFYGVKAPRVATEKTSTGRANVDFSE